MNCKRGDFSEKSSLIPWKYIFRALTKKCSPARIAKSSLVFSWWFGCLEFREVKELCRDVISFWDIDFSQYIIEFVLQTFTFFQGNFLQSGNYCNSNRMAGLTLRLITLFTTVLIYLCVYTICMYVHTHMRNWRNKLSYPGLFHIP